MNPVQICRICDARYETFSEEYDEDICEVCWEEIYSTLDEDEPFDYNFKTIY